MPEIPPKNEITVNEAYQRMRAMLFPQATDDEWKACGDKPGLTLIKACKKTKFPFPPELEEEIKVPIPPYILPKGLEKGGYNTSEFSNTLIKLIGEENRRIAIYQGQGTEPIHMLNGEIVDKIFNWIQQRLTPDLQTEIIAEMQPAKSAHKTLFDANSAKDLYADQNDALLRALEKGLGASAGTLEGNFVEIFKSLCPNPRDFIRQDDSLYKQVANIAYPEAKKQDRSARTREVKSAIKSVLQSPSAARTEGGKAVMTEEIATACGKHEKFRQNFTAMQLAQLPPGAVGVLGKTTVEDATDPVTLTLYQLESHPRIGTDYTPVLAVITRGKDDTILFSSSEPMQFSKTAPKNNSDDLLLHFKTQVNELRETKDIVGAQTARVIIKAWENARKGGIV